MKELRWLADYVVEFSNMSEDAKEIAFGYISEADDFQLATLIIEGKMVVEVSNKKRISEGFKNVILPILEQKSTSNVPPSATEKRKAVMSVIGVTPLGLGLVGWPIYRAIRSAFDECSRKCGTFHINTPTRQRCMLKCKQDMNDKVLKLKEKMKKAKK